VLQQLELLPMILFSINPRQFVLHSSRLVFSHAFP
jgi:hypothetical protein